ncbi:hypothetical protein B296_00022831 [Ensete ventricosum]|uniref:Uncharacterized protein n=1 Tax=Ensete ventricosum TaxID=4639 RepID=A0A426ZS68_ENSVE|nr:hypothetical protein B296_00022831 [Ensete ventricosum]
MDGRALGSSTTQLRRMKSRFHRILPLHYWVHEASQVIQDVGLRVFHQIAICLSGSHPTPALPSEHFQQHHSHTSFFAVKCPVHGDIHEMETNRTVSVILWRSISVGAHDCGRDVRLCIEEGTLDLLQNSREDKYFEV